MPMRQVEGACGRGWFAVDMAEQLPFIDGQRMAETEHGYAKS